jgi:hypothetical protein
LEEFVEITAQTEWRDPSGCSKLTLKVTDLASLLFNLRLNRQEFRSLQISGKPQANIANVKAYHCQEMPRTGKASRENKELAR